MAKLTRRGLLKQTSVGAAVVGVLGAGLTAAPHLMARAASSAHSVTEPSVAAPSGPLVVQVRNVSTGEIGLLVGEREIVYRDLDLVTRLLKAAG